MTGSDLNPICELTPEGTEWWLEGVGASLCQSLAMASCLTWRPEGWSWPSVG